MCFSEISILADHGWYLTGNEKFPAEYHFLLHRKYRFRLKYEEAVPVYQGNGGKIAN